ncbi:MAG: OmpA family protein [Flavobacteriaceae bacterium]|nr:OmpA family protein [Flavobacteriaceae bacterium]
MTKKILIVAILIATLSSCVSKKKFVELETDYMNTKGELQKTTVEKENLEARFAKIERRVDVYNSKINSLQEDNISLQKSSDEKMVFVGNDLTVLPKDIRDNLDKTLSKLSAEELTGAKTLKDSMNIAISYKLKKSITEDNLEQDIDVNIDKTVIMISVADSLLFRSGSYRINTKAYPFLQKLAAILKSEQSMDVMIEGHTDSRTIHTDNIIDNWDLSVKRSTAIARLLQNKYNVDPSRLIPAGRSSYLPLTNNETRENRARNRRTNIIILPNINKFFALLAEEDVVKN